MVKGLQLDERIEPSASLDADISLANISFLRKGPAPVPASGWLRAAAVGAMLLLLLFNLAMARAAHLGGPEIAGTVVGTFLFPMLVVWLSSWWGEKRSQRSRYRIFLATVLVLLTLNVGAMVARRGYLHLLPGVQAGPATAEDLQAQALRCERARDLACAEDNWNKYLLLRPDDGYGLAYLGMIKSRRDDHDGAIAQFEKAVAKGMGAYDMFAYYGQSLAKAGRTEEAVDWHYRALTAAPSLVDVRGALARLLVGQGRHFEALSLLQSFDAQAEAKGQQPYFTAQRIAIENGIASTTSATDVPGTQIRLPAYAGHFFAPVAIGSARPVAFMVDTGASLTTVSEAYLQSSKVEYRVVDGNAWMLTADGRRVGARVVMLDTLQVGPYVLRQVKAMVCRDCAALLGQSTLSRFDMQSSKQQGVEFLSLHLRAASDRIKGP